MCACVLNGVVGKSWFPHSVLFLCVALSTARGAYCDKSYRCIVGWLVIDSSRSLIVANLCAIIPQEFKIVKLCKFCNKFSLKGHILLNYFYIIWHRERVPGLLPHAIFLRRRFRIVCLSPKSFRIGNFWYTFAITGKSPSQFFKCKISHGKGVHRSLAANFTPVALEMWGCVLDGVVGKNFPLGRVWGAQGPLM